LQNKCIEVGFAGKFKLTNEGVIYMPALDLLSSGRFKFIENITNISPLSKAAIRFIDA